MSFDKDAVEALRIAGDFDVRDFYPAPFPEDIQTIELEKFSLSKLLNGDEEEGERLFTSCTTTGFCYLDMLDHSVGRQMWRDVCNIHRLGQDRFSSTAMEEKLTYKLRAGVRVFDRGYLVRSPYENGRPDDLEILNIPQSELFGTKTEGADIPGWVLKQDENTIKDVLERGNSIARTVISVLENQLQLPPGTMTKLHRLTDDSGDFLRILKYAGDDSDNKNPPEGFPPHRDATSITMVFTWLGGLQIPTPNAKVEGFAVRDEDWRWVRPEPGFAIVNVGDAMSIFTNNVLKSGIHRVVKAPGEQRPHNRISVTLATRPENNTLMKPFQSAIIPHCEMDGEPMSSLEWGHSVVSGIQKRAVTRGARDLDNT